MCPQVYKNRSYDSEDYQAHDVDFGLDQRPHGFLSAQRCGDGDGLKVRSQPELQALAGMDLRV